MAIPVLIPTPLRSYTDMRNSVLVEGSTVGELLGSLGAIYPGVGKHLFSEDGKLRRYVNVYVNDEDIRYLQEEKTPVTDKDVISIIPSIAGGRE